MWVVKIGGSLETAPGIGELLTLLVEYGRSRIVIVPGGGRFADRVRAGQAELNLSDETAHVMAIRAMEQYAEVLCGLNPNLRPFVHSGEIDEINKKAAIPVWLPAELLTGQPDIPAGWQVTSDSLALWFAGKINADALILVKSVSNRTADVGQLAASGYLDEFFPKMLARSELKKIACVCISDPEPLQQALVSGTIPPEIRICVRAQAARRIASRDGCNEKKTTKEFNAGFLLSDEAVDE